MDDQQTGNIPGHCPVCEGDLLVTQLRCSNCGTEVNGTFTLSGLATLREPHASLLEMFLRLRGNVKDMERELGLSYPTVRARLEEALNAAGFPRESTRDSAASAAWSEQLESDLAERIRDSVEQSLEGLGRMGRRAERDYQRRTRRDVALAAARSAIISRLEAGEIDAAEAAELLRDLKKAR
jgi:hypothetical protein